MSRFFSSKYEELVPYTPGEQPQNMKYVKLNTNESPFPPSDKAKKYASAKLRELNLYSDPECLELRRKMADVFGVDADEIVLTNGSDEILNFALMAFCDSEHPAAFPDISYSFYPVLAGREAESWLEFPEALERLRAGSYAIYGEEKLRQFLENLQG